MLGAALLVAAGPERLWKSRDTAPISSPAVRWVLCLAIGFYGGMVQAGVGYLILAALTLLLAMELTEANIIKIVLVAAYTPFVIMLFWNQSKIHWGAGALLAAGQAIGAWLGASQALKRGARLIRGTLLVMVVVAALKLLGVF